MFCLSKVKEERGGGGQTGLKSLIKAALSLSKGFHVLLTMLKAALTSAGVMPGGFEQQFSSKREEMRLSGFNCNRPVPPGGGEGFKYSTTFGFD